MKHKRAPMESMEILQAKLAEELVKQREDGVTVTDKKGNPIKLSTPSATLNVIRQFCKDNDITSLPEEDENLDKLKDLLPFNKKNLRIVND